MKHLVCDKNYRRERIRLQKQLNGLDYLEVGSVEQLESSLAEQCVLNVYFLGKAPVDLGVKNIRIEGGRRIRDIQVLSVELTISESLEFDDMMVVIVDRAGDFSNYALRVVEYKQGEWQTHSEFDPRYDRIEFNFKVDCPNELDCRQKTVCPPKQLDEPDINYLAKDYASFRQLILDRLALVMPDWQERHIPDIGLSLVEVLAYVGDHLSYYQDAVATEAYLDTARQRISVRRHARLVDYSMHEGCNARAWVCIQVNEDISAIKAEDIYFIGAVNTRVPLSGAVVTTEELQQDPANQYEVFEPILQDEIRLYKDHNCIKFYTWGDQLCCLPRGSTSATFLGEWVPDEDDKEGAHCNKKGSSAEATNEEENSDSETESSTISPIKLSLNIGDVLIFEEVIGPETGHPQDASPKHRHAVCLTAVSGDIDPLNSQAITHVSWDDEDALPFPLCLSVLGPAPECKILENVSIACGNVVLVDHGKSVKEDLDEVPEGELVECCKAEGMMADSQDSSGLYKPVLNAASVTFCEPLQDTKSASQLFKQDARKAVAEIGLFTDYSLSTQQEWLARKDLLGSQADDLHFAVELDDEARAHLRFGNGESGSQPKAGMTFKACYRIGNGLTGNVGAESISHLSFRQMPISGLSISKIRNPMPAQGGTAAEPVSEVKLFAPQSLRKELQRAIIADDYAAIVLREFKGKVQNASAKLRWTGSGYEILLAIDALGQEQAEQSLLNEISARLHRYRRMGHDLVVKSAHLVALEIELQVCVLPNYLRGHVKAELLQVFSNKRLQSGQLGFFHADNLTFGEDLYLSRLVAAAQAIEGVASVAVIKMQRWCELANNEIAKGVLPLGPFEIARLDNDPSFQENGILTLDMRGGR